jgi:hypothetical protein
MKVRLSEPGVCRRDWISMYTLMSDTAAGVTRGILLA